MVLGLLMLVAFAPTLWETIAQEWWVRPEWSHGFLLPPIAAWMLYQRRDRLRALGLSAGAGTMALSTLATLLVVPMLGLLLLGEMKVSWFLKPYSAIASVILLVVAFYGIRGLRVLAAPLFVLLLACPWPGRIEMAVTVPLKQHAAILATGLLDLSGLHLNLEGNTISLAGIRDMSVADACSGIRSLIALTTITILSCMTIWRRHWALQVALVVSCVPIAIALNGFRIWVTGMLSVHVSEEAASGFFHHAEGLLLFGVAALIVWGFSRLLTMMFGAGPDDGAEDGLDPEKSAEPTPAPADPGSPPVRIPLYVWATRTCLVLVLVATSFAVYNVRSRLASSDADPAEVAKFKSRLDKIPLELADGEFHGRRVKTDPQIVKAAGADSYTTVDYVDNPGHQYRIYVGGSIRNSENFHAPSYCMPAQGWEILKQDVVPFTAYEDAGDATMRRLIAQKGRHKMLVYYWFQAGDRFADHELYIRWYRFLDLMKGGELPPTLIVTVYVDVHNSVVETERRAAKFLRSIGGPLREAVTAGVRPTG
ncbi:MAG: exosortase C-terminal domain/associated protein EpsI [Planctomycetota bacterium]